MQAHRFQYTSSLEMGYGAVKLNSRTLSVAAVKRYAMRRYSAGYYIEYADLSNVLFLRLHPRIACINGCCRI